MCSMESQKANEQPGVTHPLLEMVRVYRKNKSALMGLFLFIFILILTMAAPFLYRVDPFEMMGAPAIPMGESGFLLGTD